MKRESKRFLGLFLLSILFVSVIIGCISFVSAAEGDGALKGVWDALFGGLFSGADGTLFGMPYVKLLLIFLVVMLVYAVMEQLALSDNQLINWAISIAVGFLSFMFVKEETIDLILTNYTALGVTLTSVLPLIIIIFFAMKLKEQHPTDIFGIIVPKAIYLLFSVYLLLTWVNYPAGEDDTLRMVYIFAFVGVLVWWVLEKKVWDWYMKTRSESVKKGASRVIDQSVARDMANAEGAEKMAAAENKKFRK